MSAALDQAVTDITSAVNSAVAVMQAAADAIKNSTDPSVAAAATALEAEAQTLSGAVSGLQSSIPVSTSTGSTASA